MKPLLVGEANPYQSNAEDAMRYALYPEPRNASGGRLCHVIMGLDARTYLRSFDRVDLCHPKWSLPVARRKALELMMVRDPHEIIVLCGAKVCLAFDVPFEPYWIIRSIPTPIMGLLRPTLVVIPHPSALNRAWHVPGAVDRARAVLREAGVLPVEVGGK